jgi:1-acyl-sn-glycerol-3-phosphate acyltransferase
MDAALRPLVQIMANPQVEGMEHLEGIDGPVILASNHASHLDTPILLACLPSERRYKTVVAAAADYFFDRTPKAVASALVLNALPFERNKTTRESARLALSLIEDGWNLLIFPEGTRSPDGWGQELRGGAAYLANKSSRPLVPVHIEGTHEMLPKGTKIPTRTKTRVIVDRPLDPDQPIRALASELDRAFARLSHEASAGFYAARLAFTQGTTPNRLGPDASPWRRSWARTATEESSKVPGSSTS